MEKTERFFKNHADTLAVIGVNLAIAGIYLTLLISNIHRVDAVNSRSDGIMNLIQQQMLDFKNESKELREEFYRESKEFHCRLSLLENKEKK